MTEENKQEPIIPSVLQRWKDRKLIKKQKEIEMMKLEIEHAKLYKEYQKVRGEIGQEKAEL